MKKLSLVYIFCFVFCPSSILAQNLVVVDYLFIQSNTEIQMQLNQTLFANNTNARLDLYPPNQNSNNKVIESDDGFVIVQNKDNKSITQYFVDIENKKLFILLKNTKQNKVVVDDGVNFEWKITNKTKKINGFVVKEAKTAFRGRSYTAWFAPSIPIPFGPWKFHGLPGLILQVYDNDNFFNWKIEDLQEFSQINEDELVITLSNYNQNNTVNIKEYIDESKEKLSQQRQKIFAKLPREGRVESSTNPFDNAIERSYEWEEEK